MFTRNRLHSRAPANGFKTGFSKICDTGCVLEEEEVKPVQLQLIQNVFYLWTPDWAWSLGLGLIAVEGAGDTAR